MGTTDMRVSSKGTFDWHLGYTNKVIPATLNIEAASKRTETVTGFTG